MRRRRRREELLVPVNRNQLISDATLRAQEDHTYAKVHRFWGLLYVSKVYGKRTGNS